MKINPSNITYQHRANFNQSKTFKSKEMSKADAAQSKNKSQKLKLKDYVISGTAIIIGAACVTAGILGAKKSKAPTIGGKIKDGFKEIWKMIKAILDGL